MLSFKAWLETTGSPPLVLCSIGAFNPIHRGHTKMFYNAKRYLSNQGQDVIAAYVVPKNQAYVEKKAAAKGEQAVPLEHRIKSIEAALQGTFIRMLLIDVEKGPLTDQQIKQIVQTRHPKAEVIMIVGDDYIKCPNGSPPPCIADSGWSREYVNPREGDPKLGYGLSSTLVRNSLQKGQTDKAQEYLPPKVFNYITQNRLWGSS